MSIEWYKVISIGAGEVWSRRHGGIELTLKLTTARTGARRSQDLEPSEPSIQNPHVEFI